MPRHISLIFPGQGSQSIGMLNSFSEDELDNITKISKEVLDTDIVDCIKNGPEEDLNKTSITQPALVIASYLYYKKFLDLFDITPNLLAGHSLGEYSALLASNSIKIDDAISLVHKRAKYAVDFMGWYMSQSSEVIGISINDTRNQYLAYHEGRTGYLRGTYRSKTWLVNIASQVADRAVMYQRQLQNCRAARF